jgi:hypothetical protein
MQCRYADADANADVDADDVATNGGRARPIFRPNSRGGSSARQPHMPKAIFAAGTCLHMAAETVGSGERNVAFVCGVSSATFNGSVAMSTMTSMNKPEV